MGMYVGKGPDPHGSNPQGLWTGQLASPGQPGGILKEPPDGRMRLAETQSSTERTLTCLWPEDVGPAWVMPHTVCPGLLAPHKELVQSWAKARVAFWGASKASVSEDGMRKAQGVTAHGGSLCKRALWKTFMGLWNVLLLAAQNSLEEICRSISFKGLALL